MPGRFKHVRAFGLVPGQRVWVFFDVNLGGLTIACARDKSVEQDALMQAWMKDCEVIHIARKARRGLPRWPVYSCVSAVSHLLGLRGALRPDRLRAECLRNGGTIFDGRYEAEAGDADGRSAA